MAWRARGTAYIRDTPADQIEAMDRLLAQADSDLRQAIALDPQVTPAHSALIRAGQMGFGKAYTNAAIRAGLAAAPDNYSIHGAAIAAREPKWGGSLEAMDRLAAQAQAHAAANPLLKLLLSERPYYEVVNRDCTVAEALAAYPGALDQVAGYGYLAYVGKLADDHHDTAVAGIYLSEALRFDPARSASPKCCFRVSIPRATTGASGAAAPWWISTRAPGRWPTSAACWRIRRAMQPRWAHAPMPTPCSRTSAAPNGTTGRCWRSTPATWTRCCAWPTSTSTSRTNGTRAGRSPTS